VQNKSIRPSHEYKGEQIMTEEKVIKCEYCGKEVSKEELCLFRTEENLRENSGTFKGRLKKYTWEVSCCSLCMARVSAFLMQIRNEKGAKWFFNAQDIF
jgi:hypothetical protein